MQSRVWGSRSRVITTFDLGTTRSIVIVVESGVDSSAQMFFLSGLSQPPGYKPLGLPSESPSTERPSYYTFYSENTETFLPALYFLYL